MAPYDSSWSVLGSPSEAGNDTIKRDSNCVMDARAQIARKLVAFAQDDCRKNSRDPATFYRKYRFSRCQLTNSVSGHSENRPGGMNRSDSLIIDRIESGSLDWRETMIVISSSNPTSPRSNIQRTVRESAIPLPATSGPPWSAGRIRVAVTSARPPPLINRSPLMAQRLL